VETITESVKRFLNHDKARFDRIYENHVLKMGFEGANRTFFCHINANEESRTLRAHTISPIKVPENKRQQTAELIARINHFLVLGNLEIDMDDGEATYKTSVILGRSSLHQDVVKHLLYANWMASDKYCPAVSAVAFGNVSPEGAAETMRCSLQSDPDDIEDDNKKKRFNGRLGDFFGQLLN